MIKDLQGLFKALAYWRFFQAIKNPQQEQCKVLKRILRANKTTGFGLQWNFSNIKNYEQFAKLIPLTSSSDYLHYLGQCYQFDYRYLCDEKPIYYAMTAGSTGQFKYIPITRKMNAEVKKSIVAYYYLLEKMCPETAAAPIQFMVGSAEAGVSPQGVQQGFMSGFNYKNLPAFIRKKFVVPYWVFTIDDAADRYYAIGRYLVSEPKLSAIGAFSPENISNVAIFLLARLPQLIMDIESGCLTIKDNRSSKVSFKKNVKLVNQLMRASEDRHNNTVSKQDIIRLLFPELKYAICWQGGNMGFATKKLKHLFTGIDIFDMPFSASEGIFALPYQLNTSGGIAAVNSHFLEFIAEAEMDSENPEVLPLWKIEIGKYYYLLITSSAGLYRYNIGDLIYVKNRVEKTPVIEFVAKKQRIISIANERLTENDVVQSVMLAIEKTVEEINDFVLMPTREKCYFLMVSGEIKNLHVFANEVEQQLCNASVGYAFERADALLDALNVALVDKKILREYIECEQFKVDLPSAQFKPIHLCTDFDQYQKITIIKQVKSQGLSMAVAANG